MYVDHACHFPYVRGLALLFERPTYKLRELIYQVYLASYIPSLGSFSYQTLSLLLSDRIRRSAYFRAIFFLGRPVDATQKSLRPDVGILLFVHALKLP